MSFLGIFGSERSNWRCQSSRSCYRSSKWMWKYERFCKQGFIRSVQQQQRITMFLTF